jgi:hypothetical protein
MTATEKLKAALAAYTGNTGPIEWNVVEREDGAGASLVATYAESLEVTDEPWTQFGGDEILSLAGFDRCDGGMECYQDKYGDKMVAQWAIVNPED